MANLTLSVDDELLQKAREAATRDRTSVNALVRAYLERYVAGKQRRLAALDALDEVAATSDSTSLEGWSRESLHDRDVEE